MDGIDRLNAAIDYLEANLDQEPDLAAAARIACVSGFERFFSYMTGMTLKDYLRRRRLTLAAGELEKSRVLDVALKYGYKSQDAFSRAFSRQHGITPGLYKRQGGTLRICPPVRFTLQVKGANEMKMRMIELPQLTLYGTGEAYEEGSSREQLRNRLWDKSEENLPGKLCGVDWEEPGCEALDGVWYGVWEEGRYRIAREESLVQSPEGLDQITIPAGTYAAFETEPGGFAWEEFPRLREEAEWWLETGEYRLRGTWSVEVSHLWGQKEIRRKKRRYELWLPVERK